MAFLNLFFIDCNECLSENESEATLEPRVYDQTTVVWTAAFEIYKVKKVELHKRSSTIVATVGKWKEDKTFIFALTIPSHCHKSDGQEGPIENIQDRIKRHIWCRQKCLQIMMLA